MNNNIKEAYCSYETSKALKAKGFEVPTNRYYRSDGVLIINSEDSNGSESEYNFSADDFLDNWNMAGLVVGKNGGMCFGCKLDDVRYFTPYSSPTHSIAIEWMRLNFKIYVQADAYSGINIFYPRITSPESTQNLFRAKTINEFEFDSPQKAIEAGLLYLLT